LVDLVLSAQIGQVAIAVGAMRECCQGQNYLVFESQPPTFTSGFKDLLIHILIASFCDVAFKIKSLLFVIFSISRVVQLSSINIFLLL